MGDDDCRSGCAQASVMRANGQPLLRCRGGAVLPLAPFTAGRASLTDRTLRAEAASAPGFVGKPGSPPCPGDLDPSEPPPSDAPREDERGGMTTGEDGFDGFSGLAALMAVPE
jgi:hypothetical protein